MADNNKLSRRVVLVRVLRYIRPHLAKLVAALLMALLVVALTLYVPILIGRAIDCIVGAGQVDFAALKGILMQQQRNGCRAS